MTGISDGIRPLHPTDAVTRARAIANKGGQYVLGSGDFNPHASSDVPWTTGTGGLVGSDCAGFAICWCYAVKRHRKGYNAGSWASVTDDINCNSALEDAQHKQELFRLVDVAGRQGKFENPAPGDLLLYPSFTLHDAQGKRLDFIGHVAIVVDVARWNAGAYVGTGAPPWYLLDVAQCKGPNGRAPGVILTDGSIWSHHDTVWPKPEHRSYLIRSVSAAAPSVAQLTPTFRQP